MKGRDTDPFDRFPAQAPTCRLLWEALVDIGPDADLGRGPLGQRFLVPILGGRLRGGPGFEGLRGAVLPGGADRQLLRPDGAKELDALYEMRLDDGTVLTLRNRVVIDQTGPGPRYALSRILVTAPAGPWAWLSRRVILGTLQGLRPEREAVLIRGWLAET